MPGTDELFFKPSGTKVPATKLARVGDNKDGVLSGVDAAIKNYAGRTKRYVDAKVGIGEGNDIVWLDLGKSAEEVGKQYEEAMRKKGCTDAQMVRSIGVLNDMNFFADLGFNSLKNIQTVITPMEGGEVKVRHEVPMAGAPGGKAYDEILVDKDGGYRMEGCGVA